MLKRCTHNITCVITFHFRDHKVQCLRLKQGQTKKFWGRDERWAVSIWSSHESVFAAWLHCFFFVLVFTSLSGHHHSPLRQEEGLTWKVGTQDTGERSKGGMSRSPQSKHLHRAHRGVLFLPVCLLIIWLSPVVQGRHHYHSTSSPFAFICLWL